MLTLTLTIQCDAPTDGSPVVVVDELPPAPRPTSAEGHGWTCTVDGAVRCTRGRRAGAHRSYPPIVLRINVARDAPGILVHRAT
jgi:hypothetical protein